MSDVNIEQSIFNIEADLEAIFMELEDNGGELTPEIEEKLKKLAQWQADKIQNARKTSTQTQEQVILDLLREHL